ncbi:helix-turn-helix domain-containing protein [Paraburkholderia acidicola]|uniref:Helix-turn-helix domain-containing protein n=1 Tax=Paraburkholderia acidicola TaxID=1912599 RepID=A0ABV1LUF3_9BURK
MASTAHKSPRPTARALIAENLRRLRAENDWLQFELADRSGVDRSFIAHVERQARNDSADTLDRLAIALQVPIGELFAG